MSLFNGYIVYKLNIDQPISRIYFLVAVVVVDSLADSREQPAAGPGDDVGAGHSIVHLPE